MINPLDKNLKLSPFAICTISFAIAIALSVNHPEISRYRWLVLMIAIILPTAFLRSKYFLYAAIIAFGLAGLLHGASSSKRSDTELERFSSKAKFIYLKGRIDSLVSKKLRGKRSNHSFLLAPEALTVYRKTYTVSDEQIQVFGINLKRDFKPGDCIEIKGSLSKPKPPTLPGQFDLNVHLRRNQIEHTIMLIGPKNVHRDYCHRNQTLTMKINLLRQAILARYKEIFPAESAALASALIIGHQKDIPKTIREQFVKTGTAHLLAVSGLNITLVVSFFYYAMIRAGFVSATFWNPIFAILFALLYCLIAGANAPVVRASLMIFIAAIGILMGRSSNLINLLFIALSIALTTNPLSLTSPSLQLSYLAVFSLIANMPVISQYIFRLLKLENPPRSMLETRVRLMAALILQNVASTLVTFVWLWPLVAYYFNTISLSSFVANLFAAPLYLLANILAIALLGISLINLSLAQNLAFSATFCFSATNSILSALTQFAFSFFHAPSPSALMFSFYYVGLIVFTFSSSRLAKTLALISVGAALCLYLSSMLIRKHPDIIAFSYGGKAQFLVRAHPFKVSGLFALDRFISSQQMDWSLAPFLKSQGITTFNSVWLLPAQPKKNREWLLSFTRNFRITHETDEFIKSIDLRLSQLKGKGRAISYSGYSFKLNQLRIFYHCAARQITAQVEYANEPLGDPSAFSLSEIAMIKFFDRKTEWLIEAYPPGSRTPTIYKLPVMP